MAIARPVNVGARAFSVVREFFQISIEMDESFVFDGARFITQSLPILDRIDGRFAPLAKSHNEIAQRTVQLLVSERLQRILIESVWWAVSWRLRDSFLLIHMNVAPLNAFTRRQQFR